MDLLIVSVERVENFGWRIFQQGHSRLGILLDLASCNCPHTGKDFHRMLTDLRLPIFDSLRKNCKNGVFGRASALRSQLVNDLRQTELSDGINCCDTDLLIGITKHVSEALNKPLLLVFT